MYVKDHLPFSVICYVPELEFCAVNVSAFSINVCIALAYKPPSFAPTQYFDSLSKVFFDFNILGFSHSIFLGDLNTDTSTTAYPMSPLSCFLEHFGLCLVPTGPTRVTINSSTSIDILANSSACAGSTCDTIPPLASSDHNGLLANIVLKCLTDSRPCTRSRRKVWNYRNADFNLANSLLLDIAESDILLENDINASWNNFNDIFLSIMNKCIPSSLLPNRRSKPWLNKHLTDTTN